MNRDELIANLIELQDYGDVEDAHSRADGLLLAFINDPDVTAAFDALKKWYA